MVWASIVHCLQKGRLLRVRWLQSKITWPHDDLYDYNLSSTIRLVMINNGEPIGEPRQGYDRGRDAVLEDLSNNQGFLRALALVLRLKPGGLLFAGVPCNSFAFMSQGVHKRFRARPDGGSPWLCGERQPPGCPVMLAFPGGFDPECLLGTGEPGSVVYRAFPVCGSGW